MSALTSRDALVSHFHSGRDGWECSHSDTVKPCEDEADALLASGVVVDAATLADDGALVGRVTRKVCEPSLNPAMYVDFTRDHLTALAAALSERSSR